MTKIETSTKDLKKLMWVKNSRISDIFKKNLNLLRKWDHNIINNNFISQTRENMKKALYKTILTLWIIFLIFLFIKAFNVRYEDTFREWSEVMCDIWVWNPIRWIVVAEDKERIYIKWQSQCLMYCLDDPNLEEWEEEELWATHKYLERYDDDDVKYKSICYRIWNNKDKMKAIINRYWRDDE